jgi:hypothetical protein
MFHKGIDGSKEVSIQQEDEKWARWTQLGSCMNASCKGGKVSLDRMPIHPPTIVQQPLPTKQHKARTVERSVSNQTDDKGKSSR